MFSKQLFCSGRRQKYMFTCEVIKRALLHGLRWRELLSFRKHAYSNILKTLQPKQENFQKKKNSDIFHISAQNIDCGYSLERVPTIYVLSRNKKNNEYPCKPQFYYIKMGFKGVKII